jgi:hypothetical protein
MLEQRMVVDKVEVQYSGHVVVLSAQVVFSDGEPIARGEIVAEALDPGADLTDVDPWVAGICQAAWTPEILASHAALVEKNKVSMSARLSADPAQGVLKME